MYNMNRIERAVKEDAIEDGLIEERSDSIQSLIATVKNLSASPAQAVDQLIKRYSLTEAAVQANW